MKVKKIIPEKNEQPNPLPAPSNQEKRDELAPWQQIIVAVAEARLTVDNEHEAIWEMHRRAIALCRIVEDLALSSPASELPLEALAKVMQIIEENVRVAKWIAGGRRLDINWF
jgi:hypothetical protein